MLAVESCPAHATSKPAVRAVVVTDNGLNTSRMAIATMGSPTVTWVWSPPTGIVFVSDTSKQARAPGTVLTVHPSMRGTPSPEGVKSRKTQPSPTRQVSGETWKKNVTRLESIGDEELAG